MLRIRLLTVGKLLFLCALMRRGEREVGGEEMADGV